MASASSSAAVQTGTVRIARPRKAAIGSYRILGRPLGRGGSATVYRVAAPDGAQFAVKELAPQFLGDREAVTRFRREFEISQNLNHPGIVRAHELIECNGTLNIRMELIDGVSLKGLLSRARRLQPATACWIALQTARTLAYAHSQQVIHRDVKPDNLLVQSDGQVLLGDFGTARLTNLALTRAGTLLGTPVYMAPELLAGKKDATATPASDVYSLGAVLYELIEGRSPFSSGRKGEILPLLYAKSFQKTRPMARAESPELARLIERCLARDPADRPATMEQFGECVKPHASAAARAELKSLVGECRKSSPPKKRADAAGASPAALDRTLRRAQGERDPGQPTPPPSRLSRVPIHDTRFALVFFTIVAALILLLLTQSPSP